MRFIISNEDGKCIATEKRSHRRNIEGSLLYLETENGKELYEMLEAELGKFKHHRRRNNWIVKYNLDDKIAKK